MANLSKQEVLELYQTFSDDFEAFVRYFLKDHLTKIIPEFHSEIYKLVPKTNRLVLAAPRGFAKSYCISKFYPLWCALFGHKKDVTIISASEGLAIEHLRFIKRELEGNPKILTFFGDLRSEKWSESHIILTSGVNIRARGAGGQIRGFRPDCIVLDDIETDETVESEEQRKKLKGWLFRACLNTLLPEGQMVIIGTVIHPLAVLCDLLTVDNGWVKRRYRAYKDHRQEKGNELWADLWSHEKLQERKAEIGSTAFASEFLNDPMSDETAPIKDHQIRYYKEKPDQYSCVVAVDPAYSEDKHADYKVAVVVAIDQNMNRYLMQYIRTHAPTGEFIDAVLNLYQMYKPCCTGLGIPSGGTEKEFYKSFLEKASSRKIYAPFTELKNVFYTTTGEAKRNKKSRIIASLQPLFEAGKYYIAPEHLEARDELLTIGVSRWDDVVDAMCYAEQILQPVFYDMQAAEKAANNYAYTDRGMSGYGEQY